MKRMKRYNAMSFVKQLLPSILLILLPLSNIVSAESDDPASFSECLLKYMTGAQSDYGARAIESACREVFPDKQKDNKHAEQVRCAPIIKTLTDWDAYIEENFSPKAIKKQTKEAILGGMARGGVNGSRQAQANLNRNIANNRQASARTRLEILKEIRAAGCWE